MDRLAACGVRFAHRAGRSLKSGGAAGLLICLLLLPVAQAAARSEDGRLYVDLPQGPLREAIDRLAVSARLQVLYDPAILRGHRTAGVKGSMTPTRAFERLLASTDLGYRFTAQDAVALYRRRAVTSDSPPIAAVAAPEAPLPTVDVLATRPGNYEGYFVNTALTATKVEGPLLSSPIASESISRQILQDQQANRIEDVLEGISAIEAAPRGESALGFSIRGFPTYQYYVDGVRISPDLHHDGFRDLANVERIDVVKGPASTLYGRTEPGGLINVVTKQPLSSPHFSLGQQFGTFGRRRAELDVGGPLSSDDAFLYRFNTAFETGGSFRTGLQNRRILVAPVVTWKATPQTQLTAYTEYLRSSDPTDSGLPVVGTSMPPVPIEQRVENGGEVRTRDLRVGIRGAHAFSDQWTTRFHYDSRWVQTPQAPQLVLGDDGLDPQSCSRDSCLVDQLLLAIPASTGHTHYGSLELLGTATLGKTQHSLLFGAELFDVRSYQEVVYNFSPFSTDLYAPHLNPVPGELLQSPDWALAIRTAERWYSAYAQDQVALGERLSLLLGARFDYAREWLDVAAGLPLTEYGADRRSDHAFKRRIGLVYRPTAALSLYTHYLENFGISTGIYGGEGGEAAGTLVPPEAAREWEVGAKAELLPGRLIGSLAWFNLTQSNIALPTVSVLQNAQGFVTVTGMTRSRGLEAEVQGEIAPRVKLIASYAYLDSRIVDDANTSLDLSGNPISIPGNTGKRFFGVPRHGGSLWLAYRPTGVLQHLKLGVGVVARTWREGDNANDYRLPGFTRWNLLAAYDLPVAAGRLNLQLNVDNLFNARYFESLNGTHNVMPGAPRRWLLSARMELK